MFKEVESVDALIEKSQSAIVLVLKHSTACSVSSVAMSQMEKFLDKHADSVDSYLVVVQKDRAISDEIESRFGIRHQSPQLLIIEKGEVTHNWSHFTIQSSTVEETLGL